MPAEVRNITIEQGATFRMEFEWREDSTTNPGQPGEPIPLTGATVTMQIRQKQGGVVLVEADSDGNGITLDEAGGKVTIVLTPTLTNQLVYRSCRYDIEAAFSVDDVHRLVKGSATIDPNITQAPGDPIVQR